MIRPRQHVHVGKRNSMPCDRISYQGSKNWQGWVKLPRGAEPVEVTDFGYPGPVDFLYWKLRGLHFQHGTPHSREPPIESALELQDQFVTAFCAWKWGNWATSCNIIGSDRSISGLRPRCCIPTSVFPAALLTPTTSRCSRSMNKRRGCMLWLDGKPWDKI